MIVNAGYRGKVGAAAPKFTYTGQYNIRKDGVVELLTSGTIVFLEPKVIDVFMVGGGGAGNSGKNEDATTIQMAYGGGGGGYTRTIRRVAAPANTNIPVTIGAGGVPFLVGNTGTNGGTTTFGTIGSVNGGKGATRNDGQFVRTLGNSGGSGGGGGVASNSDYGSGGYNGENGEAGNIGGSSRQGGNGQGFSTREFGEATGKLYAGGGGGGRYMISATPVVSLGGAGGGGSGAWAGGSNELTQAAAAGVANTGGGGGGGAARTWNSRVLPASGGSGIVCFREAQELPELAGTWVLNERLYPTQTKLLETVNVSNGGSNYTKISIDPVTNKNLTLLAGVGGKILYKFNTNTWDGADHTLIFPTGATASDEFRAWLASNATKQ